MNTNKKHMASIEISSAMKLANDLMLNIYSLDYAGLCKLNKVIGGNETLYNSSTVYNYIEQTLDSNDSFFNAKFVNRYSNVGIYLFDFSVTTIENPEKQNSYKLCYIVNGGAPYVITNCGSDTKIHEIKNIDDLVNNITTEKLNELFKPRFHELVFFANLISIDFVCDAYLLKVKQ